MAKRSMTSNKQIYCTIVFCIIIQSLFVFGPNLIYSNATELHEEILDTMDKSTHNIIRIMDKSLKSMKNCTFEYNNIVTIDDIFSIWKQLFNMLILQQCKIQYRFVWNLLINTNKYLQETIINTTNPLPIQSNIKNYQYVYHDIIALRRYIMIIIDSYTEENKDKEFIKLYNDIIKYFVKLFFNYLIKRQSYAWFHIHVTKSGGTTIKDTFHNTFGQNSGSYYWNVMDPTCARQYRANIKNGLRYVEREQALFTSNDYFSKKKHRINPYHGPSLCNKFTYILPFREPLERICSQASQINKHPIFNNQNILRTYTSYHKRHSNPNAYDANDPKRRNVYLDRNDFYCYNKNISVNGVNYRVLLEGIDYQNFYVELLQSEKEKEYMKLSENITSNEDVWTRIKKTSIMTENITSLKLDNCWSHPEQMRWTPVRYKGNINKLNESEFIIVTRKNFVDIAWHRCISASNVYTSWLGYNYSHNISNMAMISNFVARYKINESHFINAMNLIMQIDYVLPFESFENNKSLMINSQHQIWQILLDDIYDFFNGTVYGNKKNTTIWSKMNTSKYRREKVSSIDICSYLSINDRRILSKYNQFDFKLYQVSKLIEIADVIFYKQFVRGNGHE
eukprot:145339_1